MNFKYKLSFRAILALQAAPALNAKALRDTVVELSLSIVERHVRNWMHWHSLKAH